MPGELHRRSGRLAFAALPKWERRVWAASADDIADYCTIPDRAWTDAVGEGPWAKYLDLPNGQRCQHGPTDSAWSLPFMVTHYERPLNRYWLGYYLERIVGELARGEADEAAKFAGALAHYLQDSAVPGHNLDNYLLAELMPFPVGQYWNIHKIFDDDRIPDALLAAPTPGVLGRTVAEATFRLEAAYEALVRHSRSQAVPILRETYAGRRAAARQRLAGCANRANELVASAWHTAFCIAYGRLPAVATKSLAVVDLWTWSPAMYASQPPYFTFTPGILTPREGESTPVRLPGTRLAGAGLAVAGTSMIVYDLPPGLYGRFTARIGAAAGIGSEATNGFRIAVERTPADRIDLDINIQTVTMPHGRVVPLREWRDSRYVVFDSGPLTAAEPARTVDVLLPPAERLLLITAAADPIGHAVWGRPRLHA